MPTPLRLVPFQTIMREPLPPIDWLVEPLLSQGSRAVVFGEFGCMKSWLLLDLGLHISAGRSWQGYFSVPQPRSVLYVDEEMPQQELRRRVKWLGLRQELRNQALPFRSLSHADIRFGRTDHVEQLLTDLQAQQFDPDVIIVETLRRVLVSSENDAEAVSVFWHSVSPILTACKTLIVSHYMRKPNAQGVSDSRHRASGSTDILAGADMAFAIARRDEGLLEIECVKSRVTAESDVFRVRFQEEQEDGPVKIEFDGFIEEQGNPGTSRQRVGALIVSYLQGQRNGEARTSRIDTWLAGQSITSSQAEKGRQHLKRTGQATNPRYGYWQLREPGVRASSSANPPISIGLAVAET
jgi:AAA domain